MDHLGQSVAVPDEIDMHLASCADCRNFRRELNEVSDVLGQDEDYFIDAAEVDALVASVISDIETSEHAVVTPITVLRPWYNLVAAAAVVVFVLGTAIVSVRLSNPAITSELESVPAGSVQAEVDEADLYALDDASLQVLMRDFASDEQYQTVGEILDDMSDDELQVVFDNFQVGDIL